uniref:Uncharacterized protein n=1 Tax=Rhizophora mucronata TaxID=61149 RepID=A0A2P2N6L1_RHIMU
MQNYKQQIQAQCFTFGFPNLGKCSLTMAMVQELHISFHYVCR